MFFLFPWVGDLDFSITFITPLGGSNGSTGTVFVDGGSSPTVSVRYSGPATKMGWDGLVPTSGTYDSMLLVVGPNNVGTLSGFSEQNFADITVEANAGADAFSMLDGNDTLNGGTGSDVLFGGYGGSDTFNGNGGNDTVVAGTQFSFPLPSHMFNGAGGSFDTVRVALTPGGFAALDFVLSTFSSIEAFMIDSGAAAAIYSSQFDAGGISNALLITGAGRLNIAINTPGRFDMALFSGTFGDLRVLGSGDADDVNGSEFGETMFGGGGGDLLMGNGGVDTIFGEGDSGNLGGGAGNDFLYGGQDDDTLDGGGDTDQAVYSEAASGVTVDLNTLGAQAVGGGLGSDTLVSIENLEGSDFDDTLTGDDIRNILAGSGGNDLLIGGEGNDALNGGMGDDKFDVDSELDEVNESSGEGTNDTVRSGNLSLNLASYSNIENLALTGAAALNLTGNSGNNRLTGNDGANILSGLGGNNTMTGGRGNDTFVFDGSGNVTITDFGSTYFSATMNGANEHIPNASAATGIGTLVMNLGRTRAEIEIATTGLDWDGLQTPGILADNVTGFHIHQGAVGVAGGIIEDIGGDPNRVILANQNRMTSLWTSVGDGLTPALATSLFAGGLYYNVHTTAFPGGEIRGQIVNASTNADKINVSALNIGDLATIQTIMVDSGDNAVMLQRFNGFNSFLTLQNVKEANLLASHFTFAGTVAQTINGTNNLDDLFGVGGNDTLNGFGGNDRLFGEADNDTLNGGLGIDTMYGGNGSDTYFVDSVSDIAVEANAVLATGGNDLINSSVTRTLGANIERLTLTGGAAVNGTGNTLANTISGNNAANKINGGLGNDILKGGAGIDTFIFSTAPSATNRDAITDFTAVDFIHLENAVFSNLGAAGALGVRFWAAANGLAHDANDRIIYNSATGALTYDSNGNAAGGTINHFATLSTKPLITAADFLVI